ncbi:hypothetical protein JOB18_023659 [Solea senegalensis]|uniref:Uncharacterized protein n=1 Tax=Solea senegalensis TaxID=28829 RepID=A0AAV6S561_SOLSE|nr:hypothetical protein JOB18_023659 [Solea senegalensis]
MDNCTEFGAEKDGNMIMQESPSRSEMYDLDVDSSVENQLIEDEDFKTLAAHKAVMEQETVEVSVAKFSQLIQGFLKNKIDTMESELQQKEALLQKEKEKVQAAKMALMKKERGYLREKERLRRSIQEGEEELKQKMRELSELKTRRVDEQDDTSSQDSEDEDEDEAEAEVDIEEIREIKKRKRKKKFVFF